MFEYDKDEHLFTSGKEMLMARQEILEWKTQQPHPSMVCVLLLAIVVVSGSVPAAEIQMHSQR